MSLASPTLAGGFLTTEPPGKPFVLTLHFCSEDSVLKSEQKIFQKAKPNQHGDTEYW